MAKTQPNEIPLKNRDPFISILSPFCQTTQTVIGSQGNRITRPVMKAHGHCPKKLDMLKGKQKWSCPCDCHKAS